MNDMKLLLTHQTAKGPVFIGHTSNGRFHPVWKGESLGSYQSAAAAIDDVAGGHTFSPSDGTDTAALGISDDIADWSPVAAAR